MVPNAASISQVDQVSLPVRSMFVSTPIYTLDDLTLVFGLRLPALQPSTGDSSVSIDSITENRLDLVAQRLFGQSANWWTIADISNIIDPLAGVVSGTVLRAPSTQRLPS